MIHLISLLLMFLWLWGIVLAKGALSTFFAVIVPFWSYYLVTEHIATKYLQ